MRKADYSLLARLIKRERDAVTSAANTEWEEHAAIAVRTSLRDLAIQFAQSASVDEPAFLKACGIE